MVEEQNRAVDRHRGRAPTRRWKVSRRHVSTSRLHMDTPSGPCSRTRTASPSPFPRASCGEESWMKDLGDDIADIPITELTIPGTHDMGTYGLVNGSFGSGDSNAAVQFHVAEPSASLPAVRQLRKGPVHHRRGRPVEGRHPVLRPESLRRVRRAVRDVSRPGGCSARRDFDADVGVRREPSGRDRDSRPQPSLRPQYRRRSRADRGDIRAGPMALRC